MFEIFQDEAGEWRFRIKGANGEIVMTSEGYSNHAGARRGFMDLRHIIIMTLYTDKDSGL